MGKIARCLVLVAGMAGLVVAGGVTAATAVQKEKEKAKDTKADKDKDAKAEKGTVEVAEDKAGQYRFRIKDADGKVIAMPPKGYAEKADVLKALDQIKATLTKVKPVEVKD